MWIVKNISEEPLTLSGVESKLEPKTYIDIDLVLSPPPSLRPEVEALIATGKLKVVVQDKAGGKGQPMNKKSIELESYMNDKMPAAQEKKGIRVFDRVMQRLDRLDDDSSVDVISQIEKMIDDRLVEFRHHIRSDLRKLIREEFAKQDEEDGDSGDATVA